MCKSMTQIKRRKNIPVVNMHDRDVLPPVCPQVNPCTSYSIHSTRP